MNDINKKYKALKDKLETNNDFLDWNKNFTKKMNLGALYILSVNVIMASPVALYSVGLLPNLAAVSYFFKVGMYGAICGAGVVGTALMLNVALALNRKYLKSSTKHLNQKLSKIKKENQSELLTQNSKITKEDKKLNQKNSEDKSQSCKYVFNPEQQKNYSTNQVITDTKTKHYSKIRTKDKK